MNNIDLNIKFDDRIVNEAYYNRVPQGLNISNTKSQALKDIRKSERFEYVNKEYLVMRLTSLPENIIRI